MFDNIFEVSKTQVLLNQQNDTLSRGVHEQGDTHQCWAFSLATMLQHSQKGMEYLFKHSKRLPVS